MGFGCKKKKSSRCIGRSLFSNGKTKKKVSLCLVALRGDRAPEEARERTQLPAAAARQRPPGGAAGAAYHQRYEAGAGYIAELRLLF